MLIKSDCISYREKAIRCRLQHLKIHVDEMMSPRLTATNDTVNNNDLLMLANTDIIKCLDTFAVSNKAVAIELKHTLRLSRAVFVENVLIREHPTNPKALACNNNVHDYEM